MLEACMLTSSRSGDADSVDRQSFLVLFRVREMYPWAFCPACHLVPLWSLLHTLCPIWAAGLGKGEKDLLQAPNCIKLSNKALLSLKEKRIKNSCYIYSGQKKKPHSHITGSPSSLIELCQQQPSHFSFPSILPFSNVKGRLLSVQKSGSSRRKNYF